MMRKQKMKKKLRVRTGAICKTLSPLNSKVWDFSSVLASSYVGYQKMTHL